MGVFATFSAERERPAAIVEMSGGVLKSTGFTQDKLHLRKSGEIVNPRTNYAGRYVSDAADSAREIDGKHGLRDVAVKSS